MRKWTGGEKIAASVSAVLFLLFVTAAVVAVQLFGALDRTEAEYADYRSRTEISLSDLEKAKNAAGSTVAELRTKLELAEKTKAELERQIGETETALENLKQSFSDTDTLYRQLTEQLASLQAALLEKQTEADALRADINELGKTYSINMNRQLTIMKQLEILLTEGAPMNMTETQVLNEDGAPVLDENDQPVIEVTYAYPKLAVYYEDIGCGYRYER